MPCESKKEPKQLGRIVGQDEMVGALNQCVEVSGLGIDGSSFDLQVDEDIGPKVIAHRDFVLTVENAQEGVEAIGIELGMVAEVDAYSL